jgi:DHA1 family inner membrane transport protein
VATLLGVPLGSLLGHAAAWRAPFAVLTALTLAVVVLLALVLPTHKAPAASVRDELRVVTRKPVLLAITTIAPLQGLILHHAGAAPTLAVSVNVGAFNLGAAVGSGLGGLLVAAGALRWTGLAGAVLSLTGLALTYLILPGTRTASRTGNAAVSTAA